MVSAIFWVRNLHNQFKEQEQFSQLVKDPLSAGYELVLGKQHLPRLVMHLVVSVDWNVMWVRWIKHPSRALAKIAKQLVNSTLQYLTFRLTPFSN